MIPFLLDEDDRNILVAGFLGVLGIFVLYLTWHIGGDPLFWLYRTVFIPVIDFVTFGQFHGIFHNGYPELFVFGLVSANAQFRSGHLYLGPYGWLNSWIIGFVFMYAMLHYGLATAIVVHIIYDVAIAVANYIHGH